MIRRPLGNSVVVLAGLAVLLAAVVAEGRGGGQDGALGIGIALVVLIGGAVCIQRLGRVRVLIGFNPDGLWAPSCGWLAWGRVRHIEVRQTSNPLTGRHHTLWVRYQPVPEAEPEGDRDGKSGLGTAKAGTGREGTGKEIADAWLDAKPGLRQAKAMALVDEMERCWVAATRRTDPDPSAGKAPQPWSPLRTPE